MYPEFSRSNANVRTASSSAPLQVLKLWRLPYAALISLAEDVVRGAFVRVDFQCHERCCVHRGTRTPTFSVPVASIGVESLPVISFVARFVQVTLTGLDFPLGVFSFTLNPSAETHLPNPRFLRVNPVLCLASLSVIVQVAARAPIDIDVDVDMDIHGTQHFCRSTQPSL